MACEVLIVASQSGGIPDVIGDAGLLFHTGDRQGLINNILRYVKDESLRKTMAKKGRELALATYDVPVIVNLMIDAIRATISKSD